MDWWSRPETHTYNGHDGHLGSNFSNNVLDIKNHVALGQKNSEHLIQQTEGQPAGNTPVRQDLKRRKLEHAFRSSNFALGHTKSVPSGDPMSTKTSTAEAFSLSPLILAQGSIDQSGRTYNQALLKQLEARKGSPSRVSPPSRSPPTRSSTVQLPSRITETDSAVGPTRGLPAATSHTSDQLNSEGDEYVARDFDDAGEAKVNGNGYLARDREYRIRTFTLPGRGEKLFMLATECARTLQYRDSYLLFSKNRSLFKIILDSQAKNDLVTRDILPYSYRSRQIAAVTALSIFRQFGSKVIRDGRRVRDDYWEAKALKQGFTEDDPANSRKPGATKIPREPFPPVQAEMMSPLTDLLVGQTGNKQLNVAAEFIANNLTELSEFDHFPRPLPMTFGKDEIPERRADSGAHQLLATIQNADVNRGTLDENMPFPETYPKQFSSEHVLSGALGFAERSVSKAKNSHPVNVNQNKGKISLKEALEPQKVTALNMGQTTVPVPGVTSYWSVPELERFPQLIKHYGRDYEAIATFLKTKSSVMVKNHFLREVNGAGKMELQKFADEVEARGEPIGPLPKPIQAPTRVYQATSSQLHRSTFGKLTGFCLDARMAHTLSEDRTGSQAQENNRLLAVLAKRNGSYF